MNFTSSSMLTPLLVVAGVSVIAGGIDVVRFKIPNVLTVPLLLSGLIYHGLNGSLLTSLAGAAFCFSLVLFFYLIGAMGAGDVKFMAGVGAWLGMAWSANVFLAAALATGVYSVALLIWEGGLARAAVTVQILVCQARQLGVVGKHLFGTDRVEEVAKRTDRRRRLVPFAAMVALGVIVLLIWGSLL